MKCRYDKKQITLLVTGSLSAEESMELEEHLSHCYECQAEFTSTSQLLKMMEGIPQPQPSAAMRPAFNAMLDSYKEAFAKKSGWHGITDYIRQIWTYPTAIRWAYIFTGLLFGVAIGGYFFNRSEGNNFASATEIEALSAEVQQLKQMTMLSLLTNPSASERIRAVNYAYEIKYVDEQVTGALLTTLNNDPNVNVRLVALEALAKLANQPSVREGLIQSIAQQQSPLIQSAIADVMVKLQEKRSVEPLQKLLHKKDLNRTIRAKIEKSIHQLI